jgi:hypothetical protein
MIHLREYATDMAYVPEPTSKETIRKIRKHISDTTYHSFRGDNGETMSGGDITPKRRLVQDLEPAYRLDPGHRTIPVVHGNPRHIAHQRASP